MQIEGELLFLYIIHRDVFTYVCLYTPRLMYICMPIYTEVNVHMYVYIHTGLSTCMPIYTEVYVSIYSMVPNNRGLHDY